MEGLSRRPRPLSSTERSRAHRARRRDGGHVVALELSGDLVQRLIDVGYLDDDLFADRPRCSLPLALAASGCGSARVVHRPRLLSDNVAGDFARNADRHARDLAPVVEDIRASGASSLRAIPAELNGRGMLTRRGGC